ncbi:cell division protein FtsK, partial [Staphylococcus agnetis]
MAMNEIALFKGTRVQPYQKYIDFILAGVFASAFFIYRVYQLINLYNTKYSDFDVKIFYVFMKSHIIYLLVGTLIIFLIVKLIAQIFIRFKVKDLA